MSNTLFEHESGVQIDTYAGPLGADLPRTRIQVAAVDPDTHCWAAVAMTMQQWAALCDGIRQVTSTAGLPPAESPAESAGDHPAAGT